MNALITILIVALILLFLVGFVFCSIGVVRGFRLHYGLLKRHPEIYDKYKKNYFMSPCSLKQIRKTFGVGYNDDEMVRMIDKLQKSHTTFLYLFGSIMGLMLVTFILLLMNN